MEGEERVLVFGRGGWLGRVLWSQLRARGATVLGPRSQEVDVRDASALGTAVERFRPTAVLNLAAARPSDGEEDLEAVNAAGARNVAEACARAGARLVHVSTDALLDGHAAPYADDARAKPLTPYGRSKARGEAAVLAALPTALCVRTSLIWDPDEMDRGTRGFAERLEAGEPCRLFTDEIRCPLDRETLARSLLDLLDTPTAGTLNVAGRETLSRHDYATLLLEHFGVAGLDRIERVRAADLEREGAPPRPRDLRLVVDRAESLLGYPLRGVREVLAARSVLFPPEVVMVTAAVGAAHAALFPEEQAHTTGMVPKRLREFTAGRVCARTALARVGHPQRAIGVGAHRQPLWPEGVVGSITHTDDLCAAAVSTDASVLGLGLDLEPDEDLPADLIPAICRPEERSWLEEQPAEVRGRLARTLFSAKETVFKCVFPRTQTWLDFQDATVRIHPDGDAFEARILVAPGTADLPATLGGRIAVERDHIWTAAVWRGAR